MSLHDRARIGDQVFTKEGGEVFGAVRAVARDHLMVYVESGGDFVVAANAVRAVHDGKVILDEKRLEPGLVAAIAHAHDKEDR